jgi:hypothetical protein
MYVWIGSVMQERKDVTDNLSMDIRTPGILFSWSFSTVAVTGCPNRFMLSTRKTTLLGDKIRETRLLYMQTCKRFWKYFELKCLNIYQTANDSGQSLEKNEAHIYAYYMVYLNVTAFKIK